MSKMIKDLISNTLKNRYGALDSALWIEFLGVDGLHTTEFRRGLRAKKMRMEIVKTALFRRAMTDTKLAKLGEVASGPVAIVTGGDSLVDVAKFLDEWAPKLKGLKLRAAIIDGEFVSESQVGGLSKMPTKRDMQGRIAACVRSPGGKLASAILAGGSNIAGCLKALIDKLEKGETGEAAPAAA